VELCGYLEATCNLRGNTREITEILVCRQNQGNCIIVKKMFFFFSSTKPAEHCLGRSKQKVRDILKTVVTAVMELLGSLLTGLKERFACRTEVNGVKEPGS